MLRTRKGYIEIPLPHVDTVVETVKASVYSKSEKYRLEMLFRKSALYDLLKNRTSSPAFAHDDVLLLVNLWKSNNDYLDYCISFMEGTDTITLLPSQSTLDKVDDFAREHLSSRYAVFAENSYIVGAMVDALGFPVAQAVYFGSYLHTINGYDIINAKVMGITPEEVMRYRSVGMSVTNPKNIIDSYKDIRKATQSIDSILYAASLISSKLAIKMIENNIGYIEFSEIIRRGDSVRELEIILQYQIDPMLITALHDAESLGYYANEGFVNMGLSNAA